MDNEGEMPSPAASMEEKLLFLQENLSNFVKQYNLPIIESALVISKYINILLNELKKKASLEKENLPLEITDPWPITGEMKTPKIEDFPLDKLMQNIDQDRMDIFDTIIRTIINGSEIPFVNAVMLLRDWERVIRTQLVKSTSPGHLFSPLELDDNF
ncbi:MAG: hypothetical protein DBX07_07800 [Candidatus Poseidoniales archaeon]|jgi:hypothetical protein|uniref:Uncharacterized protein n=1 Tax=uncultured Poseidoniia archaeon TaxID=1697135 RepID=A0A1B1TDW1_9ARCH|nr:hypothetical protein [uncultured Candidatus Thalassoarchaea sp.]MAS18524.1 hypothetical protein [Euryarchaeota archaeon]OUX46815.1 MAG: hypothetical protein CBE40_01425 [Euryarchaeota archaeon TMED280]RCH72850.1 MAG: hypothetical protein DBX07_07800 [Candidatus Poseidoniales archaeon]MAV19189.1 hypothetical protein [Euryarchaeota archaeon]|tara:strand:- start:6634 stop:7104 length:471 start_codon:yes stop_codon:yes gene_type:complete